MGWALSKYPISMPITPLLFANSTTGNGQWK